jgi:hypothetical protein
MAKPKEWFTALLNMRVLYPLSTVYGVGVTTAIGIALGWFDLSIGIAVLSLVTLLTLIAALRGEVHVIHGLVNSQRDVLLTRIDKLVDYLIAAGVNLPPGETEEKAE